MELFIERLGRQITDVIPISLPTRGKKSHLTVRCTHGRALLIKLKRKLVNESNSISTVRNICVSAHEFHAIVPGFTLTLP